MFPQEYFTPKTIEESLKDEQTKKYQLIKSSTREKSKNPAIRKTTEVLEKSSIAGKSRVKSSSIVSHTSSVQEEVQEKRTEDTSEEKSISGADNQRDDECSGQ